VTRIVAGTARGRPLRVPRGRSTRPTSDRVREALFARLDSDGVVRGARVLDLFAGSGALGLEAASRGADHVLLVDSSTRAAAVCRRNVAALGVDRVEVRTAAASTVLATAPAEPYDLVLLDPPYDLAEDALAAVLDLLVDRSWLADRAVVVVERSARSPEPRWPGGLLRFDDRRYGETRLWLAEPPAVPEPA
jgi:16S rRNA (guanine966-N2)-methyltransferase